MLLILIIALCIDDCIAFSDLWFDNYDVHGFVCGATDGYDAAFVAECCEVCVRTCVWSRLYFALH